LSARLKEARELIVEDVARLGMYVGNCGFFIILSLQRGWPYHTGELKFLPLHDKALHVIVVGNNDMGWNWRSWGQYHKAEEAYMHQHCTKAPTQPRDLVNIYAIYQRSEL
jgi:hypothetical protein